MRENSKFSPMGWFCNVRILLKYKTRQFSRFSDTSGLGPSGTPLDTTPTAAWTTPTPKRSPFRDATSPTTSWLRSSTRTTLYGRCARNSAGLRTTRTGSTAEPEIDITNDFQLFINYYFWCATGDQKDGANATSSMLTSILKLNKKFAYKTSLFTGTFY